MILSAKKIEKLTKFIIKALTKAIKAGHEIIALYDVCSAKIQNFRNIISALEETLNKVNTEINQEK